VRVLFQHVSTFELFGVAIAGTRNGKEQLGVLHFEQGIQGRMDADIALLGEKRIGLIQQPQKLFEALLVDALSKVSLGGCAK
jgi:hypothetical protein